MTKYLMCIHLGHIFIPVSMFKPMAGKACTDTDDINDADNTNDNANEK